MCNVKFKDVMSRYGRFGWPAFSVAALYATATSRRERTGTRSPATVREVPSRAIPAVEDSREGRLAGGLGIAGLHPHELRHTSARLAIASRAMIKVVQQMLGGHKSATTTLDLYGHLYADQLDELDELDDSTTPPWPRSITRANFLRTFCGLNPCRSRNQDPRNLPSPRNPGASGV